MHYHRDISSMAELIIWKLLLNVLKDSGQNSPNVLWKSILLKTQNTSTNLLDSDLTRNEGILALRGRLFVACFPVSVK